MTKKSYARLTRDAAKARAEASLKDNRCWDDLNDIKDSCTQLLLSHGHIAQYSTNQVLIAAVKDKETLTQNIRLLGSDLNQMKIELGQIAATHEGRSGGSQDPDEIVGTYEVYERYNLFMERHQAVVMPTALHITEQFGEAEKRLKGALDIIAEADPKVTTDVEFREVPVGEEPAVAATTTQE